MYFLKERFFHSSISCFITNGNPPVLFSMGLTEWVTTRTFKPCEARKLPAECPVIVEMRETGDDTYSWDTSAEGNAMSESAQMKEIRASGELLSKSNSRVDLS